MARTRAVTTFARATRSLAMSLLRRLLPASTFAILAFAIGHHQPSGKSSAADLTPVLFPASADWTSNQGASSDLVVALVEGEPVFRVGQSGLILNSKLKI